MYCDQRSQYIRPKSKKNSFRGNYMRKYGKHFSPNNVTVRLAKIMNNLLGHLKILIFKVIFSVENWLNLAKKISLKNIGDQLLLMIFFENCYF